MEPNPDTVYHVGITQHNYFEPVQRLAEEYGQAFASVPYSDNMHRAADRLKHGTMLCMWNGMAFNTPLCTEMAKAKGIPTAYYEQGMLGQKATYTWDPLGFLGRSILAKDLSWVTREDMDRLYEKRAELQRRYPLKEGGNPLCVLQIHNDTQVLYFSPYRDMNQFMYDVAQQFPNTRVTFRSHPRSCASRTAPAGHDLYDVQNEMAEDRTPLSFLEQAARASVVVGITSTCLWEAAILGKPVIPIGDHPLRHWTHNDRERACAGALALTLPRYGPKSNPAEVLRRFGIRPLERIAA